MWSDKEQRCFFYNKVRNKSLNLLSLIDFFNVIALPIFACFYRKTRLLVRVVGECHKIYLIWKLDQFAIIANNAMHKLNVLTAMNTFVANVGTPSTSVVVEKVMNSDLCTISMIDVWTMRTVNFPLDGLLR